MNITANLYLTILCVMLYLNTMSASGSVIISGTRVIYPAEKKDITIRLRNTGKEPVIVQSWIDNGNSKQEPTQVHFLLLPEANRVDPGKRQILRITHTGLSLPLDKESLFWLNVQEFPLIHKPDSEGNNKLVVFRSRIKFFFRPTGLVGNPNESARALTWSYIPGGVKAINPTPYYISLVNLNLINENGGRLVPGQMIAPRSSVNFTFPKAIKLTSKLQAEFIDDHGTVKKINFSIR